MNPTRREFLGILSAAAATAAVPAATQQADRTTKDQHAASSSGNPLLEINLLQGTNSTHLFSRGNTLPIVALPFGMAHWTLETYSDTPWFFNPHERRTQGIRCTHQLSPWLSDYGYATFFPFTGTLQLNPADRASSYRPEEARLHPHSLKLELLRSRTTVELTPTERCAILRLHFTEADAALAIDLPGLDATISSRGNGFLATVHANAGGVAPGFATYYAIRTDVPAELEATKAWKSHTIAALRFKTSAPCEVHVRIATSFISAAQAEANLDLELGEKDFAELTKNAADVWEEHLSRAIVEGGTEDQQRVFYSALYRALLFPRVWHEPDAKGEMHHWSPYSGKVTPGVMYADHGYWDVYRAWYPLMSILYPKRLGEILQAWVNAGKEGGWLPQFPCPGYRACMTGSLIDAVFADAAVKGIQGFDLPAAYSLLRKHATEPGNPDKGYGRRGIESYLQLNYCAVDQVKQSVAETVDAAYGDFCIAQIAAILQHKEDADMFRHRSQNWRNLFDPQTGFLRGKRSNGEFLPNFDPIQWGDPYVEGSAWQHRFDVPHDPEGLMQSLGGQKALLKALDTMLTQDPAFHVGTYEHEIHEMSEMAAVPFGQYAHSNQPVHHILYLYAIAGRRDRLQFWVHRILTELYTPETFPGDEDTGSMSAWFLLSSMGLYPLCPGRPEYTLGRPLFSHITIIPQGEQAIHLEAVHSDTPNTYADAVEIDGKQLNEPTLQHSALLAAKQIVFHSRTMPHDEA